MRKNKITLILILLLWSSAMTYYASRSPEGGKVLRFVKGLGVSNAQVVSAERAFPFVIDVVTGFYSIEPEGNVTMKEAFLRSSFSDTLYDKILDDLIGTMKKDKATSVTRNVVVNQVVYDVVADKYKVSLSLTQKSGEKRKKFFVAVDLKVIESNNMEKSLIVSEWKEVPQYVAPRNFVNDGVMVKNGYVSSVKLPCKTKSWSSKEKTPEGVVATLLQGGSKVELRLEKSLEKPIEFISYCGRKKFITKVESPGSSTITLLKTVDNSMGFITQKTKEERILDAIKDW